VDRPNVLLLYTDQQRWDALGAAGNEFIQTPHLDGLARQGALFEHAYVNAPVCMPSRQSMLSGLYPETVGTTCNGIEMPPDVPCLHNLLQPYGYHTANNGKLHFKNHSNRDHRRPHPTYGFDQLIISDEPGCYDDAYIKWVSERAPDQVEACRCSTPPAWQGQPVVKEPRRAIEPYVFRGPEELSHTAFVAEQTIDYLRRHRDDRFFAIAGFYAPHAPLNPPARFVEWYRQAEMPLPAMNPDENHYGLDDDAWRQVVAYYYALVSHVDDQVGRILRALDELGLRERTLVIFTSDHGEHLGDHGQEGKGPPGYDSCARVPLLLSWPGVIAPQRRGEIVEAVDLAPTVLDYCGVQVPPTLQGRSYRPLLEGRPYQERSSAYIAYHMPFGASWRAVRGRDWFYAVAGGGQELLFDLRRDPRQLHNVAADLAHSDALAAMRRELISRWFDVEAQSLRRTAAY